MLDDLESKVEIDEIILTNGENTSESNLSGKEETSKTLSANSLEMYFGMISPNIKSKKVEVSRTFISEKPKNVVNTIVLIEAKAILTILLQIRIIEKKSCGFLIK